MYVPEHFREENIEELHALMRAVPFATLVTAGTGGGLTATHLPTLLNADHAPLGAVEGHLARPNDQWKTAATDQEALAIFSGPNAYIHPGWYPSKAETGKAVPTWNYAAVHAYGRLEIIHDMDWLEAHVRALSDEQERHFPKPWSMEEAPDRYIAVMLRGIVGVRLEITRIEGKWKMSQNRKAADRIGVVTGLRDQQAPAAGAVADLVANRTPDEGEA